MSVASFFRRKAGGLLTGPAQLLADPLHRTGLILLKGSQLSRCQEFEDVLSSTV